jgi:hypothetical protein
MSESTASFLPFTRPAIDEETIAGVAEVLRSGWLTGGPKVLEFERALSDYFGCRTTRVFNSGTAALEVALRVLGIGPGDEVITTPLSWVATANVILSVGARPVFVDVDPATRNIDLERVQSAITPRTRALMPVDLAGLPVDRDRLYEIAQRNGLRVIEDAAQAMGASWRGRRIGSFGDLVAVSFHANKNMTTGEGGCLVLPDDSLLPLTQKLRLQGAVRLPDGGMEVDVVGGKFNLTDVAARIGLGQLALLERFNDRRRSLARRYFACFDAMSSMVSEDLPPRDFHNGNWHMFQVLLPLDRLRLDRGGFIEGMRKRGIGIGVHYPAMHLFSVYRRLGYKEGDFPSAEKIGREIVTLPLFPAMLDEDVERVCRVFNEFMQRYEK